LLDIKAGKEIMRIENEAIAAVEEPHLQFAHKNIIGVSDTEIIENGEGEQLDLPLHTGIEFRLNINWLYDCHLLLDGDTHIGNIAGKTISRSPIAVIVPRWGKNLDRHIRDAAAGNFGIDENTLPHDESSGIGTGTDNIPPGGFI
jgi:hypothetical protein